MSARQRTQPTSAKPLIRLARPAYDWLEARRAKREAEMGRQVTFTEVIEQLRTEVEGFELLAAHTKVVER